MGLDLRFFGPQMERCVKALESMAESFGEMAETAKVQRAILDAHNQQDDDQRADLHVVEQLYPR